MKYSHENKIINEYLNKQVYIMFKDLSIYSGILKKHYNHYKIVCYDKDIVFSKSHVKAIYHNGIKVYKG